MQMLSLYKDPEGNIVFSAHEEASASAVRINSTIPGGSQAQLGALQEENDDLKKKIKQLEEAITEYQVHLAIPSGFPLQRKFNAKL